MRVPDAVQRATLLRRAGTHLQALWTPDQQRTTPRKSGVLRRIRGTRWALIT